MNALPDVASRATPATAEIQILICGAEDRGDDAAALVAARELQGRLPAGVRMLIIGQLSIDDLLAVPADGAVVIVDAASGISPGSVVDVPIDSLRRVRGCRPRSSHALEARELIDLAAILRGAPLTGRIVVIGGDSFGLGSALSPRVAAAVPDLIAAVLETVADLRTV